MSGFRPWCLTYDHGRRRFTFRFLSPWPTFSPSPARPWDYEVDGV